MKRFLVSTTIAHNPGDEMIWSGIRNLLEQGMRIRADYVYYNRNPDLQDARRSPIPTEGNYVTTGINLNGIDGVILAGSPEWFGNPMEGLYRALLARPDIPVYALGIGLGDPTSSLDDAARTVLSRAKKIITRSVETTEFLSRYGISSIPMVCPALFCSLSPNHRGMGLCGYVLQAPGSGWHEVEPSYLEGIDGVSEVLVVHRKEMEYYTSIGKAVRYAASGNDVLTYLRRHNQVVSTRLHAAIGALSLGLPATVIGDTDFRIRTAGSMYKSILGLASNIKSAQFVETDRVKILRFKEDQWSNWIKELSGVFGDSKTSAV